VTVILHFFFVSCEFCDLLSCFQAIEAARRFDPRAPPMLASRRPSRMRNGFFNRCVVI
jgi:hypothetical protein